MIPFLRHLVRYLFRSRNISADDDDYQPEESEEDVSADDDDYQPIPFHWPGGSEEEITEEEDLNAPTQDQGRELLWWEKTLYGEDLGLGRLTDPPGRPFLYGDESILDESEKDENDRKRRMS